MINFIIFLTKLYVFNKIIDNDFIIKQIRQNINLHLVIVRNNYLTL